MKRHCTNLVHWWEWPRPSPSASSFPTCFNFSSTAFLLILVRLGSPVCIMPSYPNFWTLADLQSMYNWVFYPESGQPVECRLYLSHRWFRTDHTGSSLSVPPPWWLPQIQIHQTGRKTCSTDLWKWVLSSVLISSGIILNKTECLGIIMWKLFKVL